MKELASLFGVKEVKGGDDIAIGAGLATSICAFFVAIFGGIFGGCGCQDTTTPTAPIAFGQTISTAYQTAVGITLTSNVDDGVYTVVDAPLHGALTGVAPDLNYAPNSGFSGTDQLTFTVSWGDVTSDVATVTITVGQPSTQNHPPTADDQAITTAYQTPVAITLTGVDPDGDTLTYSHSAPSHGTLTGSSASLTYTPATGYSGQDSFTFTTSDGSLTSNVATVSITVDQPSTEPLPTSATLSADVTFGNAPLTVHFSVSATCDATRTIAGYYWDFGSGLSAGGSTATHNYTTAGVYNALAKAVDSDGGFSISTVEITVQ